MGSHIAHADIVISEVSPLDFGTLVIPSIGEDHVTVPADGAAYHGDGILLSGMPRRGQYLITGMQSGSTISIDISSVAGANAATLGQFEAVYNGQGITHFPAWGLQDPGAEGKLLYVGATLTYSSAVMESSEAPGFDITVIYE